ncbi:MAG: TonB-dependent receptor [Ignavibacteria bacterium]
MKIIYVLILIINLTNVLIAGEIKGRVVSEDGSPIPNVNLILLGTKYGTSSDLNGQFLFSQIPPAKYKLQASAIGYETKVFEVNLLQKNSIDLKITLTQVAVEIQSVVVSASKLQSQEDARTSLISIEPKAAKILPGAGEDIMRTLQALPGVSSINDFSSQLIIRGSGPDQNLIIFNDVEVFNPYRLYGAISMFNPETVEDINLITGGFPARYGDRLSAVLEVTNRDGARSKFFSGNVNINLTNANVVFEGKNPFGLEGSWIFNSRRTYYDLLLEPFVKRAGLIKGDFSFPNFYDFQFQISTFPSAGHKVSFTSLYSRDGVALITNGKRVSPDSLGINDQSFNNLSVISYQYASRNFSNKLILSFYNNKGETNFDSKFLDPTLNREDFSGEISDTLYPFLLNFSFNSLFDFRKYSIEDRILFYSGKNNFEFGAGFDYMTTEIKFDIQLDPQLKAILNSFSSFRSVLDKFKSNLDYWRFRLYGQSNLSLFSSNKIFLSPGLRFDYYDILRKSYISPRIGLSFALNDITTIRAFYGHYYQSPGYEKLRDQNVLFDFSRKYTDNLNAEKSIHYILSFERYLTPQWQFKTEVYLKDFRNLIVPLKVKGTQFITQPILGTDPRYLSSWTQPVAIQSDSATSIPVNNSTGRSYGWEIFLAKINKSVTDRIDGWISYSLSYSTRNELGKTIPFRFEQRHNFNFVMNYKFSEKVEVGIRWNYSSGLPYTEPIGIKPRIVLKDLDGDGSPETPEIATKFNLNPNAPKEVLFNIDYGLDPNFYNARRPDYHRLDLRLSYYTKFWRLNWLFYLDVINVYNRKNVVGYDYYIDANLNLKRRETYQLPIFPTLGVSVRF